jgi:hypothetical protein
MKKTTIEPTRLTKILDFVFGEKCPNCGSRGHRKTSHNFTRGWNHLCTQASGDFGKYCESCQSVYFEKSDEEYLDGLPDWCTHKGQVGRGIHSGFTDYNPRVVALEAKYYKPSTTKED